MSDISNFLSDYCNNAVGADTAVGVEINHAAVLANLNIIVAELAAAAVQRNSAVASYNSVAALARSNPTASRTKRNSCAFSRIFAILRHGMQGGRQRFAGVHQYRVD